MKLQVVTVIGNIGSGKTTVTPVIARALKAKRVDADDLFQTIDPFREMYLKDIKRWALANELWLTLERVILIKKYFKERQNKHLVIDSGLLMSWAYTYGHFLAGTMTPEEWRLYRRLFDKIAINLFTSSLVVYLECAVPTLMKRIKKRGRKFELKYYNPAYLKQIENGLEKLKQKLQRKKIKVITVAEAEILMLDSGRVKMAQALEEIKDGYGCF
ncbi:MAG: deoxynucleoside kinase [Patescibacteria group bacterium]|nr:deoxynucleoside kinase [Patescibacteria group bacterium]